MQKNRGEDECQFISVVQYWNERIAFSECFWVGRRLYVKTEILYFGNGG
jgi:hypothetical protein